MPTILKNGDEGPEVMSLQKRLGIPWLKQDGIFGPATESAVKAFQASHGLVVDGEAGPDTNAKLNEHS
jgi:peptidoglycan hydrolase-like protein with peptidoglycan-binding domain